MMNEYLSIAEYHRSFLNAWMLPLPVETLPGAVVNGPGDSATVVPVEVGGRWGCTCEGIRW